MEQIGRSCRTVEASIGTFSREQAAQQHLVAAARPAGFRQHIPVERVLERPAQAVEHGGKHGQPGLREQSCEQSCELGLDRARPVKRPPPYPSRTGDEAIATDGIRIVGQP